jgi:predicted dehydrogenase
VAERVGLGILGVGRWAAAHAGAAARSESVRIVNCFARTPQARDAYAEAHGLDRTAESIEALLSDPAVEAVIVSTPNDLHARHVAAAVEAGKPVLVDKPLSVDVAEGLALLAATRSAGIPVGVAHHARRLAGHRAARAWIEGQEAGEVRMAQGDFSNNRAAHMKSDAWHRTARGSEAGVLIQVGIHQVDVMLYLLGPAVEVNARFEYEALGPSMPDAAAVTMTHASGALSVVTSSWTTPSHYRTDLLATGGNLSFRLDHGHWTSGDVDDHGELVLDPLDGRPAAYPIVKGDPLRDQLDELGRSARDGTPMMVDVAAGLRAVAVVEASVLSARQAGAAVSIERLVRESGGSDHEVGLLVSG